MARGTNQPERADSLGAIFIRFRPVGAKVEQRRESWLPQGPLTIGVTAGASTPNNKIGETIERIAATRGASLGAIVGR